jgi:hypothetical protein
MQAPIGITGMGKWFLLVLMTRIFNLFSFGHLDLAFHSKERVKELITVEMINSGFRKGDFLF